MASKPFVIPISGQAGITVKITSGDAAASLATALVSAGIDMAKVCGALLTLEDYDARLAFGGTTATTAVGHWLSAGQSMKLEDYHWVKTCSYINKTAGQNAIMQVTVYLK